MTPTLEQQKAELRARLERLQQEADELDQRIAALESALTPEPPAPGEAVAKFPRITPDICRCGGNKDRWLVCPDCGGYLF